MLRAMAPGLDEAVSAGELAYVADRRASVGLDPGDGAGDDLVGLALSGGGLRAATLDLGLLQALHAHGLFRHIDYLSTASGGGFVGTTLTGLMSEPARRGRGGPAPFPFEDTAVAGEPGAVRWMRGASTTLLPRRWFDRLRVMAIWSRGVVVNLAALAPVYAVACLLTVFAYADVLGPAARGGEATFSYPGSAVAGVVALVWLLVSPLVRWGARPVKMSPARALYWREVHSRSFGAALFIAGAVAAFEVQQPILHAYMGWPWAWVVEYAGALSAVGILTVPALLLVFGVKVAVAAAGALVTATLATAYLWSTSSLLAIAGAGDALPLGAGAVAALAAWGLMRLFDVNATSLHGHFRDRLSRAFLVGHRGEGGAGEVQAEGDVPLSQICPDGSGAPYHLINATLNLTGDEEARRSGRNGDFFMFSRYFVGGPSTGYAGTRDMEQVVPSLQLASAMAVSAAAAAPNSGVLTVRALTPLMTLLNARLGLWIPSPALVDGCYRSRPPEGATTGARMRWRARHVGLMVWHKPTPDLLWRELLGQLDARRTCVNVTDAGHIENLGAYELLRRRCRLIVVSDVESDPEMLFSALTRLLRYARLDLGVEVEIDLEPLQVDGAGLSQAHFAVGTIRYPEGVDGRAAALGTLIYLKSSLTGDEDLLVDGYRAEQRAFPHESTADLVFEGGQFEAYRSLGHHIGEALFAHAPGPGLAEREGGLEAWVEGLRQALARSAPPQMAADEQGVTP